MSPIKIIKMVKINLSKISNILKGSDLYKNFTEKYEDDDITNIIIGVDLFQNFGII
jgi:hypothetical protein